MSCYFASWRVIACLLAPLLQGARMLMGTTARPHHYQGDIVILENTHWKVYAITSHRAVTHNHLFIFYSPFCRFDKIFPSRYVLYFCLFVLCLFLYFIVVTSIITVNIVPFYSYSNFLNMQNLLINYNNNMSLIN